MRVAAVEGYRIWAPTYDTSPNPLLELESSLLPQHFPPLARKLVADVGCGTGRWAQYAAGLGARVIAMDLSHEMLLHAARKPGLSGALVQADAASLPLPANTTDVVVCSFTIAYLTSLDCFAGEVVRISRPGSRIIITDLHPHAARAGWKRGFRGRDDVYELDHSVNAVDDILAAFGRGGLSLQHQMDAHLGPDQFETFRRAGKESAFHDACRVPAVWIGIWEKL